MTHKLKSWGGNFGAIARDELRHTIRKQTDRNYKVGDTLILEEFIPEVTPNGVATDPNTGETLGVYTGAKLLRQVSYVTIGGSWGLPADLCVLSLRAR